MYKYIYIYMYLSIYLSICIYIYYVYRKPNYEKLWNASETRQFCCPWVHHHDIYCHLLKKYPLKIVGKSHLFAMLSLRSSNVALRNLRNPSKSLAEHLWTSSKYGRFSRRCWPIWVCLKIGYIPNYSHLIGIMISKTIGFRGTQHFQTHPFGVPIDQARAPRPTSWSAFCGPSAVACRAPRRGMAIPPQWRRGWITLWLWLT